MTHSRLSIRNSCLTRIKVRPWKGCKRSMLEELTYILTRTLKTFQNKFKLKPWLNHCCGKLKTTSCSLMNSSTSFLFRSNSKFCSNKRSYIKQIATIRALHQSNEEEILQHLLEGPQMSWQQTTRGSWVSTSSKPPNRTQSLESLQAVLI